MAQDGPLFHVEPAIPFAFGFFRGCTSSLKTKLYCRLQTLSGAVPHAAGAETDSFAFVN